MNWIAKKISESRKLKGLTQEELAEKANINLRTIQRIESAESNPRETTLSLICDVLEIDPQELIIAEHFKDGKKIGDKIINGLFLLILNLSFAGVIGFMILDSNANSNSVFGGYIISVFLPFFIVVMSSKMSGMERMLKFGMGYIAYFLLVIALHGFHIGFVTGLFPCLIISLTVLYYGNELIKTGEKKVEL